MPVNHGATAGREGEGADRVELEYQAERRGGDERVERDGSGLGADCHPERPVWAAVLAMSVAA